MSDDPIQVGSSAQWKTLLAANNVVVADFYADWCGPCKMIAPVFASLSREHTRARKIVFAKVNVDHQRGIASTYNVSAMPTFIIFHHGEAIKTLRGANPPDLRAEVSRALALSERGGARPGGSFLGEGQRLGGSGVRPTAAGVRRGVAGGQESASSASSSAAPLSERFDVAGFFRAIYTFIGLYFWTLFSIDPYKAAETSPFNPANAAKSNAWAKEAKAAGPKKLSSTFRTLADLEEDT